MLKPLVPKFHHGLFGPFKRYRRKTGFCEAETDSSRLILSQGRFTQMMYVSPRTTVTPYPTSYSSALVQMDRKGFDPTKSARRAIPHSKAFHKMPLKRPGN